VPRSPKCNKRRRKAAGLQLTLTLHQNGLYPHAVSLLQVNKEPKGAYGLNTVRGFEALKNRKKATQGVLPGVYDHLN
jgi:hypothetical protein